MIELLAPAGSYEGFEAALGAGADAVYVGGAAFGARAYAKNFTEEELLKAIDTAHLLGKKLYLTVNTLLKNKEIDETFYDYFRPYYERGLDAVIVQDLGVAELLRKYFPEIPIHASTQMTVTGPEGMKYLEKQGLTRVVPARELSLEELSAMHRASSLEIEVFIHGALCYSYSGQCLFSSFLGGRSGNRGRCAQPCRLPYRTSLDGVKFDGGRDLCPLSLKDICTLDILPQILDAGVTSLKIEGRMKKPEYTAGVVSVYRKYLDLLRRGRGKWSVDDRDRKFLLEIFSRGGSCEGYYRQHNGSEMMAFTNEKKASGAEVELRQPRAGVEGSLVLYPDCPAVLTVERGGHVVVVSEGTVQRAQKQPMTEERVRQQMEKTGSTLFFWQNLDIQMEEDIFVPVKLLNELRRKAFQQLEEECLQPFFRRAVPPDTGCRLSESFHNNTTVGEHVAALYASCETAEQFAVLDRMPGIRGIYAPFSVIRRALLHKTERISSAEACRDRSAQPGRNRIPFPCNTPHHEKEYYLTLPHITRREAPAGFWQEVETLLENGLAGFLVPNLEMFAMLKERGYAQKCVIDHSLYTWNDPSIAHWEAEEVLRITAPVELNGKELKHRDNRNSEFLIYGYLPFMVSAQCVRKNRYGCRASSTADLSVNRSASRTPSDAEYPVNRRGGNTSSDTVFLSDRYDTEFPVQCVCDPWRTGKADPKNCYNRIYNSIPYGLLKEAPQVKQLGMKSWRLAFTMESGEETGKIAEEFLRVYLQGEPAGDSTMEFTKGHYKRGVE